MNVIQHSFLFGYLQQFRTIFVQSYDTEINQQPTNHLPPQCHIKHKLLKFEKFIASIFSMENYLFKSTHNKRRKTLIFLRQINLFL